MADPAKRSFDMPAASSVVATVLLTLSLALSGCSPFGESSQADPSPTAVSAPQASKEPLPFNSEFTRDGTFQSHQIVDGIDFVYTIWSSKTTPRMQQWYARGQKYFSFTFQGYDTHRRLRDKFATKRRIWLERMRIDSVTTTTSGTTESPYRLNEFAPDVTFDPEARTRGKLGMLITSPKGAFELRNQMIGNMDKSTRGITLTFRATVNIQNRAGSEQDYHKRVISIRVPIAIFKSQYATRPQPVPYDAQ